MTDPLQGALVQAWHREGACTDVFLVGGDGFARPAGTSRDERKRFDDFTYLTFCKDQIRGRARDRVHDWVFPNLERLVASRRIHQLDVLGTHRLRLYLMDRPDSEIIYDLENALREAFPGRDVVSIRQSRGPRAPWE